jgi:co-chaperonin GroES (HSP10)
MTTTTAEEVPAKIEGLLNAYKEEQEIKKVLDPNAIEKSTLDRMPNPTGYRLLVLPYAGPATTKGGIILSDNSKDTIQMTTVCAYVLKMGDLCYKDKDKFPNGPWCKEKDWVIFGRYAGSRFKIEGGEVRILNDDEIIAKIDNPADILHMY